MPKIDILIPTYNRARPLKKNLQLLASQIAEGNLFDEVQILLSDNASTDGTIDVLRESEANSNIRTKVYWQEENLGLEKNAIFLLGKSSAEFVMFLGDDDYLPAGYLEYLVQSINKIDNLGAIIPGNSSLHADGRLIVARAGKKPVEEYGASFMTSLKLSKFGHQLSGLLLRRDGLYDDYCARPEYRNIYPFIAFLTWNCLRGMILYASRYQVSITVFNSRDWKYDASGLLTEIFKNYHLVYGRYSVKSFLSCSFFVLQQPWRLRLLNPRSALGSLLHLIKSRETPFMLKVVLPAVYLILFAKISIRVSRRLLTTGRLRRNQV